MKQQRSAVLIWIRFESDIDPIITSTPWLTVVIREDVCVVPWSYSSRARVLENERFPLRTVEHDNFVKILSESQKYK